MVMFPPLASADGRRAWALLALVGGSAVMTLVVVWSIWLIRDQAGFVFWLALAAHLHILLALTGLSALLVKRSIYVSRDRIEINDAARAADQVAEAAETEADRIKEGTA